jgi:hypothetical protein
LYTRVPKLTSPATNACTRAGFAADVVDRSGAGVGKTPTVSDDAASALPAHKAAVQADMNALMAALRR